VIFQATSCQSRRHWVPAVSGERKLHYPTSIDRQGAYVGAKYRSALFFNSAEQARLALVARQQLDSSGQLDKPVATVILPLGEFQKADEEHQRHLEKHGGSACSI